MKVRTRLEDQLSRICLELSSSDNRVSFRLGKPDGNYHGGTFRYFIHISTTNAMGGDYDRRLLQQQQDGIRTAPPSEDGDDDDDELGLNDRSYQDDLENGISSGFASRTKEKNDDHSDDDELIIRIEDLNTTATKKGSKSRHGRSL
mmetsp:Transcript_11776/g.16841  ORF Transcript_11776/g.16841 Transcript_11776/m.16841 type:complete len:146 (-) Transcript_11776:602-1039(-)